MKMKMWYNPNMAKKIRLRWFIQKYVNATNLGFFGKSQNAITFKTLQGG